MTVQALIEAIRKHIEEIGDCWEWTGATQSNAPTPTMRWNGKVKAVRRFIVEARGKPLHNKLATCKCRNELCVNPDHVMLVSRKQLQDLVAKERQYQTNPVRMKKLSEKARRRAKLTPEQVEQIREAEGTQRLIAAQFGITQATVSCIKRGKTWRDYSNPFAGLFGGKK